MLKLESEILSLQKGLEENNISENEKVQIYSDIDVKVLQRKEISKYKTRGAILRSKSRWYNEGEKNTKYFLNLEKRHFNKKKKNHQTPHINKRYCRQYTQRDPRRRKILLSESLQLIRNPTLRKKMCFSQTEILLS